jgi:hypothetical protein
MSSLGSISGLYGLRNKLTIFCTKVRVSDITKKLVMD